MDILNWRADWVATQPPKKAELIRTLQLLAFCNSLAWAFAIRLNDRNSSLKSKIIFVLRFLAQPAASSIWFFFLHQSSVRQLVVRQISLLDTIHRPFYDRRLSIFERLSLLQNHFALSMHTIGVDVLKQLIRGERLPLASFHGKNDQPYQLALISNPAYQREGGLTLALCQQDTMLQCLTFSLDQRPAGLFIRVGGTQSCQANTREQIKEATKALYGIQPRLLLIEALRFIAQDLQCIAIECVGKKNHIYQALRYRFSKQIRAEYDQLWTMAGGIPHFNGNFLLPLFSEEKPLSERPANKRAEYRGRDNIKIALREQLKQHFKQQPQLCRHEEITLLAA